MQQRNKRAKIRPCVRSTRAWGGREVTLLRSPSSRVRPIGGWHDDPRSAEANFLFAVSFAFLLFPFFFSPLGVLFFRHPENNFFCPLINKKVFFLTKFLYFSTKKLAYSFWFLLLNARFLFFQFCPVFYWIEGTTDKTLTGIFPFVYIFSGDSVLIFGWIFGIFLAWKK